jgi:hypothetical protein
MTEKDPVVTGHEGEAGSYLVVDGKRVPNMDAPRTLTPDDPGYAEAKARAEAEAKARTRAPSAPAPAKDASKVPTPVITPPPPGDIKGGK